MRTRQLFLVVAGLFLTLLGQAQAQSYPTRPIRLISPFAAALGAKLADRLGASVVIENRPGAGAVIGITALARSAPDGYTLVLSGSTLAVTGTTRSTSNPRSMRSGISRRSRSSCTTPSCSWRLHPCR